MAADSEYGSIFYTNVIIVISTSKYELTSGAGDNVLLLLLCIILQQVVVVVCCSQ